MYKKNIAVYNNKKKKQTRELCVRARVCVSLSLSLSVLFMCAQYVYKSGNAKKMERREKKDQKKKEEVTAVCLDLRNINK